MQLSAVITAGGRVDGEFARAIGTDVKALAPFGDSTLVELAIGAARAAGAERVALVAGESVRRRCEALVDQTLDAADDGGTNVLRALAAWDGDPLVYLTSDLPFVTGDAVRAFVLRSAAYALTMPLASERDYADRFPQAPEHVVELGGERVANGNVFFIAPAARAPLRRFATRFFDARKSKLRMAMLLGLPLLVRFAMRRLTIEAIERKALRTLGVPVAAIRDCDPGICYDVDTLAEYRYAKERT